MRCRGTRDGNSSAGVVFPHGDKTARRAGRKTFLETYHTQLQYGFCFITALSFHSERYRFFRQTPRGRLRVPHSVRRDRLYLILIHTYYYYAWSGEDLRIATSLWQRYKYIGSYIPIDYRTSRPVVLREMCTSVSVKEYLMIAIL